LALPIGPLRFWCYFNTMSRSNKKIRRKPGRPATGRDPVMTLRFPPSLKSDIEGWARHQHDNPKRSEAIRRLIEYALADFIPSFAGRRSTLFVPNNSDEKRPLTSAQIRAGRALVRWSAEDLSRQSAVSLRTIRRAELVEGQTSMTARNDLAIRRALEAAGIEFTNGDQPGVRLTKTAASSAVKHAGASKRTATAASGKAAK